MIGPLELAIVAILILIFFGYRYLPQIGRSSGKAVRTGVDKAKDLGDKATKKAGEVDTKQLARQAGEHVRDVRELKEAVTGTGSAATGATAAKTTEKKAGDSEKSPTPSEPAPEPEAKTEKEST